MVLHSSPSLVLIDLQLKVPLTSEARITLKLLQKFSVSWPTFILLLKDTLSQISIKITGDLDEIPIRTFQFYLSFFRSFVLCQSLILKIFVSILTSIHAYDSSSLSCDAATFQPCSDIALSNLNVVVQSFRIYAINDGIPSNGALALGRYPEDSYYGGQLTIDDTSISESITCEADGTDRFCG